MMNDGYWPGNRVKHKKKSFSVLHNWHLTSEDSMSVCRLYDESLSMTHDSRRLFDFAFPIDINNSIHHKLTGHHSLHSHSIAGFTAYRIRLRQQTRDREEERSCGRATSWAIFFNFQPNSSSKRLTKRILWKDLFQNSHCLLQISVIAAYYRVVLERDSCNTSMRIEETTLECSAASRIYPKNSLPITVHEETACPLGCYCARVCPRFVAHWGS
jgi:hypothetical protein